MNCADVYFVTGATGIVGTALCRELLARGASVVAFVRNGAKAHARLPRGVTIVCGDVRDAISFDGPIDYIIHAAGTTSSRMFVEKPVEVADEIFRGARNVLDFAIGKKVKGLVFLSTMEVYGITDSDNVGEDGYAALDSMSPRSCYPEAKRLAECLFASAAKEYGLRAMIARLAQTFGAGVDRGDGRVFAQFAAAAAEGRDIVLSSKGETARCYCSLNDAVSGILTILERGAPGAAYNVADPGTFCTIREMAEMVAREFSGGRSRVVIAEGNSAGSGYLPSLRMRLNVDRLKALGWRPHSSLENMFREIIEGWQ